MKLRERIEYTNLKPDLKLDEIKKIVEEINKLRPRALVLAYQNITVARKYLDSAVKLVTVAGYPFCSHDGPFHLQKVFDELDIVIPLFEYYMKGNIEAVHKRIKECKEVVKEKPLKVILETNYMDNKEVQVSELVKCIIEAGADIIKTNTGLSKEQFTKDGPRVRRFEDLVEDVGRIQDWTKKPIKASGGIKRKEQAKKLIEVGATYIGTSNKIFWVGDNNE